MEEVKPTSFLGYRDYLQSLYLRLKSLKGRYSYLKFAVDLGFSETNVIHQVIQGKRPLSVSAAQRIIRALKLRGSDRLYLLAMIEYNNARSASRQATLLDKMMKIKTKVMSTPVEKGMLEYYSEWHHSVIREMIRMDGFQADPQWISQRVVPKIRPEQAKRSLELLQELDLMRWDEDSRSWQQTSQDLLTQHETLGLAFTNFHLEMLSLSTRAVTNIPKSRRDVSAVTVCLSEESVQKLKSMIHEFQMKLLAAEKECPSGDQVYQVNIQLFPFTKQA